MNSGFTQLRIWVKKGDKARIESLVESGEYTGISEFGRKAIRKLLQTEYFHREPIVFKRKK